MSAEGFDDLDVVAERAERIAALRPPSPAPTTSAVGRVAARYGVHAALGVRRSPISGSWWMDCASGRARRTHRAGLGRREGAVLGHEVAAAPDDLGVASSAHFDEARGPPRRRWRVASRGRRTLKASRGRGRGIVLHDERGELALLDVGVGSSAMAMRSTTSSMIWKTTPTQAKASATCRALSASAPPQRARPDRARRTAPSCPTRRRRGGPAEVDTRVGVELDGLPARGRHRGG